MVLPQHAGGAASRKWQCYEHQVGLRTIAGVLPAVDPFLIVVEVGGVSFSLLVPLIHHLCLFWLIPEIILTNMYYAKYSSTVSLLPK
jgi:hypothetical protein